ncbi:3-hydroxyisobutyrate dehydrogenase, mitochondrial [Phymastichus coffea]|uniref:3-hydroxyisobutyrate dehydrogenase, mitochondrial n=1 Tax=Phymastichus coffea TaxID=108790 RepID=UPI00273B0150|nr:3-hydroxyisobutyrate dehydrogenase, mitochondrial [Phymastichus coffea]
MGVLVSFVRTITPGARHFGKASQREFSSVGFVGLGNMGAFMARNLIKKGYKLTVYDINKKAVEGVVSAGAKGAQNVAEVSKNSEVVVTMLPMNQHVLDCYTGKDGIISAARKGTLLVDSSTIDSSVAQQVAHEAQKSGLRFIDGPVSGGVVGAENGTLTFMVGGAKSDYEQAKSFLEAMGSRAVHCGEVGMGQVAKICNNMLLAIQMIGLSEALSLGDKLGLDPKILTDIVNTSTGRCWSSEIYNPVPGIIPTVPSSKNYEGGFGTALISKDLGLAQAAATRVGSPIALGSLSHQIYRTMMAHGLGPKDFSVIYQFIRGQMKI